MFNIRRITIFCLEKRFSKYKMTIFSTNLGGYGPFDLTGYDYALALSLENFLRTPLGKVSPNPRITYQPQQYGHLLCLSSTAFVHREHIYNKQILHIRSRHVRSSSHEIYVLTGFLPSVTSLHSKSRKW